MLLLPWSPVSQDNILTLLCFLISESQTSEQSAAVWADFASAPFCTKSAAKQNLSISIPQSRKIQWNAHLLHKPLLSRSAIEIPAFRIFLNRMKYYGNAEGNFLIIPEIFCSRGLSWWDREYRMSPQSSRLWSQDYKKRKSSDQARTSFHCPWPPHRDCWGEN